MRPLSVDVLLAAAVLAEAICVVGVVVGASVYDRLHYAGATCTIAPFLVFAAVVVEEGAKAPSWNAGLVALAMLFLNAVVTHATARVGRRRDL